MAAYTVVDWVSSVGTLAEVGAEIETKLETLDSTNNPIITYNVISIGNETFQALITYTG